MTDDVIFKCDYGIIERKWTEILLNWVIKCVHINVDALDIKSLEEILNKYKDDVFIDFDVINIDTFIARKFPLLGHCLYKDESKKLYIFTSVVLYYCCTTSRNGQVEKDICKNLTRVEQITILKFCEVLADMDITMHNVETAVYDACKTSHQVRMDLKEKAGIVHTDPLSTNLIIPSSEDLNFKKALSLKFKSSITFLPSLTVTETSVSKSDLERSDDSDLRVAYLETGTSREIGAMWNAKNAVEVHSHQKSSKELTQKGSSDHICQDDCACTRCSLTGPCCGDPGGTRNLCEDSNSKTKKRLKWKCAFIIITVILLFFIITIFLITKVTKTHSKSVHKEITLKETSQKELSWKWICNKNFCQRTFCESLNISTYSSLNRCILLCTGLQIWPYPTGRVYYNKTIVALTTKKIKYKFLSTPSDQVQNYLAEAFKLFLNEIANIEKKVNANNKNHVLLKIDIHVTVENDPDPRLRIDTDEAYTLELETMNDHVLIRLNSASYCGVRHSFETLLQLILYDQITGNLITYSNFFINDAPSYKYRGLMLDTARNFLSVIDLIRTIDGMASCKLNTLHWRMSVTSFPLRLDWVSDLKEYGFYDSSMVYTRKDVQLIVKRAAIRGIRVLIEVAVPDPVGRFLHSGIIYSKEDTTTFDDVQYRLSMEGSVLDLLEDIYSEIINLTNLDDVFHLSNGVFALFKCHTLINERERFLNKALRRLRIANKGVLPKLPIIWYESYLKKSFVTKTWERFGVQLSDWDPTKYDQDLSNFRVIHSAKWDLSCEINKQRCTTYKTWQQMYAWKSWRNINAFSVEGGESLLWTDIVDSSNLDYHLWPRAAAVAERLWSDVIANSTANSHVYMRLDSFRKRMIFRGVNVKPIWPARCSKNPSLCLKKLNL